jgi:signal transduction histidine kinase
LSASFDLAFDLPDHFVTVTAARSQFDRGLINLVINAHDAMPAGGTLPISLAIDDRTSSTVLSVGDTGFGARTA